MCSSNDAKKSAAAMPDTLCDGGTSICTPEGAVKYKLEVSSPGIDYAKRTSHGAAVALNDDWDCEQSHPAGVAAPARELEPIFDLDFKGPSPKEDDLLKVSVKLTPAGPGAVKINITSGAANIRIWPSDKKGAEAEIITAPKDVPTAMLPKDIYVEGLKTGSATIEAKYTSPEGLTCTDSLKINVVSLVEKAGGTRKIIYDYNTLIDFEVEGGPANYEYDWDLDGDGSFNNKAYETGFKDIRKASCKYGPVESADTVLLTENAANKRQIYPVAVKLTGGLILKVKGNSRFGGAESKGIRVSLATHQGDPLPAQSTAGLHTIFKWSNTVPVKFNASPHNGANRIFYNPAEAANAAESYTPGLGAARRVLHVGVGPGIWTSGQKKEDLIATVNHEALHCQQDVSVRDNIPANNVWRLLDNHYGNPVTMLDFNECESHFSEVLDANIGWKHLHPTGQNDLRQFFRRYTASLALLVAIPATPAAAAARAAAIALMQNWYKTIPFDEMKRPEYEFYVRAPV